MGRGFDHRRSHRLVLDLLQHLHARLRLLGEVLRAVAEPRNKVLEVRDAPVVLLLVRGVHRAVLRAHLEEGVVVAAVVAEPLAVDEHRRRRHLRMHAHVAATSGCMLTRRSRG